MDLLMCPERPLSNDHEPCDKNSERVSRVVIKSYSDPVLLTDKRVLENMMFVENKYTVNSSYFENVQKNGISPSMRSEVASWMLGVCEEQKCSDEVFPLAVNYMDRLLSVIQIHKTLLQLLGASCLFISSKLKESRPLSAEKLCAYTDNSITQSQLMAWELAVLSHLRWDIASATACDFLEHILVRLPISEKSRAVIKTHAQIFIALFAIDHQFSTHPASMVAAATIIIAADGLYPELHNQLSRADLVSRIHSITRIEPDCLSDLLKYIGDIVKNYISHAEESSDSEATSDKLHSKPTTPTDVQEINF